MSDSVDTMVDTTSSRERIKRALSHGKIGRASCRERVSSPV